MQLSMSDTVTFYKDKKNTTNNNFFTLLLLIMSRGIAICDTWMTRVRSLFARACS